jgi:broad specificity phosphatase PhoE
MNRRTRLLTLATAVVAATAVTPLVTGAQAGAEPKPTPQGYDVLFVRHAETDYPPPEEELNATGIEQAAALAEQLADEPVDAVHTSLMVRSFQTGDDVAADHDLPVLADEDISEVDFDLGHLPREEQYQRYGEIMQAWLAGEERDNGFGGESYREVEDRWTGWWEGFVAEHRADRGTGVVVAHGAIYALMLPETCTNEVSGEFSFANVLDNTGMVKARLHPNGTLTCSEWNGAPVPSAP